MRTRRNGCVYECVVVDVNTQQDFLDPRSPWRVVNAQALVPTLRHIVAWVLRNQVPVVSSMESHYEYELDKSGEVSPCVDGSTGQQKLRFTLLPNRVSVEGDNTLSMPLDLFQRHQQVIFRKQTPDLLGNPKADRFLTQLPVGEFILFGLGLEGPVKALALALRARSRQVKVIADGCGYWNVSAAEFALRQMLAKGVSLITVPELLQRKLPRIRRYSRLLIDFGKGYDPGRSGVYPAFLMQRPADRNGPGRTHIRGHPFPRAP